MRGNSKKEERELFDRRVEGHFVGRTQLLITAAELPSYDPKCVSYSLATRAHSFSTVANCNQMRMSLGRGHRSRDPESAP